MARPLLEQAGYYLREDPKDYKIQATFHAAWKYTWIHPVKHGMLDCHLWHRVMFEVISDNLPREFVEPFVPSPCQQCFKVVLRMRTLEQLDAVLELQYKMGHACKCGIEENRPHVRGLYGAYWYNRGLEEGRERYREVKAEILQIPILAELLDEVDEQGIPRKLFLKKGCTEFEQRLGRSDEWTVSEEQKEIEELINKHFVRGYEKVLAQPDSILDHVKRTWIEYAWEHDDPTVEKFLAGRLIKPLPVVYHYMDEGLPQRTSRKQKIQFVIDDEEGGGSDG